MVVTRPRSIVADQHVGCFMRAAVDLVFGVSAAKLRITVKMSNFVRENAETVRGIQLEDRARNFYLATI